MADTVDTTGTAAAEGAEEGTKAVPSAEQKNKLRSFLDSLFGGEGAENPAGDGGAAAEGTPGAGKPEGRTYTEAELQEKLAQAQKDWETQQQETARLAKLSPEERAKAEQESSQKEIELLKSRLLQRDLKDEAVQKLEQEEMPVGLADLLDYTSKESAEKSMQKVQETFKSCLAAAIKERLRGKTPEGLGQAARSENLLRDQIAKNIRGGLM